MVEYEINTTNICNLPPSFLKYFFIFIYVREVVGVPRRLRQIGGHDELPPRMATYGCGTFGDDEKGTLAHLLAVLG